MSHNHTVHIQLLDANANGELLISRKLWEQLGLTRKTLKIEFGHQSTTVKVILIESNELEIFLPSNLFSELKIPFYCRLKSQFKNGTLRLGPIIGILMADRSHSIFFEDLLTKLEDESLFLFLFTPHDINWQDKTIIGTFPDTADNGKKNCMKYQVPFPNVVYNRIYGRENEQKEIFSTFQKNIELYTNAKMFNPSFFNKDMVYRHLKTNPEIMQYIPETRIAPSIFYIKDFLKKYQNIYLKPISGSFGYGIFKVSFDDVKGYLCQYRENSQEVRRVYRSVDELIEAHFKYGLLSTYLLQQAIDLVSVDDQRFDFRIHLNKDRNNHWKVVAIAPFLTRKNDVTTHTGAYTSRNVLQHLYGERSLEITKKLKEVSINAALALESSLNQPLGELGIDIGVDSNDRIWIFEINSKPSPIINISENLINEYQHSVRLLSEYFQFLSGF